MSTLLPELPEPAAWLVTDGRTYHDKAFVSRERAEMSIAERNDGARLSTLLTADQVRAIQLEAWKAAIEYAATQAQEKLSHGRSPLGRIVANHLRSLPSPE